MKIFSKETLFQPDRMAAFLFMAVVLYIAAACVSMTNAANAETSGFPDVDQGYWAYDEIRWAEETGLINGHDDGRFGPGNAMSEAQFVTILKRYFQLEHSSTTAAHWAQPAYETLSQHSLRMPGLRDDSIKNRPVTRGVISQALAHSQGQPAELEQAIEWMFRENITTGRQDGDTPMERFDVNGKMTRAQAAVFFKRLHDQQFTKWNSNALLDLTAEGSNAYTEMVRSLYEEKGVTLYARGDHQFATADQTYYHLFQAFPGEQREYVVSRTTEDNLELVSQAAEALGAPHDANTILEALKTADTTNQHQQLGTLEIYPRVHDIFLLWDET
ncbi:S-layer homology domain-containing protein [Alteribacillus persepolensis]|uniref:S-layer homology domain-containing protein n=1 Tax=Alteribacillus persepolensis TaxID=568899 RepID=A0A1G8AC28_9BACI|nr:S-layer homology domain-containing protein [Alteribacillus persepolensis]SDH18396.1 S-layer homology domain-containing protein [Alteribacillus persepolensis]